AAVDDLGKSDLRGVALRSPYGLPPRNAAAPPPTPPPGTRQERQAAAIERGRKSGNITWREGLKLRAAQRRITALEVHLRASGGHLTYQEAERLNAELDEARSKIRAEQRDGYRRWSVLPRVGR
ncbi:MAG: hypothetical protein KJ587_06925, partial [Alphaproteobacteria bacterium]|nr:hypothetical protein [Alphaproteobacteria bacterium]